MLDRHTDPAYAVRLLPYSQGEGDQHQGFAGPRGAARTTSTKFSVRGSSYVLGDSNAWMTSLEERISMA
jgi:hypothetical protein